MMMVTRTMGGQSQKGRQTARRHGDSQKCRRIGRRIAIYCIETSRLEDSKRSSASGVDEKVFAATSPYTCTRSVIKAFVISLKATNGEAFPVDHHGKVRASLFGPIIMHKRLIEATGAPSPPRTMELSPRGLHSPVFIRAILAIFLGTNLIVSLSVNQMMKSWQNIPSNKTLAANDPSPSREVRVFYNLFVDNKADSERVSKLVSTFATGASSLRPFNWVPYTTSQ